MKIALVGNNDGPLVLARSMLREAIHPVCIGLQKPVSTALKSRYGEIIDTTNLFSGFGEGVLLDYLKDYEVDLLINGFCNFKFDRLLKRYEVLNVHLAPLPKYRGRHPMHWALINGESEFGVTIHRMNKAFDSGAILWQKMVPIEPGMSVAELRESLIHLVAKDFGPFLIEYQRGNVKPFPNKDAEATYAPRRYPKDSQLTEWSDRNTIYRKVMALRSEKNPAFIRIGNQDIPVFSADLEEEKALDLDKEHGLHNESKISEMIDSITSVTIDEIVADGVKVCCQDGKIIGLYGFRPEKYGIKQNQKIA